MNPQDIKARLGYGDMKKIAEAAGVQRQTVRLVLKGEYGETLPCYLKVLRAALVVAAAREAELSRLAQMAHDINAHALQRQQQQGGHI